MKKLVSLILVISILFSFNSFAEGIIWGSNHYSTIYNNNGSNFSDPFYNSKYYNNYINEYNGTILKNPAFIRLNPDDTINEPIYIQGGPLTLINGSKYEVVLTDGNSQLYNRVKFHFNLTKSRQDIMDTMNIKLNGVSIAKEEFIKAIEDDYYVWIYKPGNITIEFNSWDIMNGNPGQSILTILNVETYNG